MINILTSAKSAKREVGALSTQTKNDALLKMAQSLRDNENNILSANAVDIQGAKGVIPDVMLDRLLLTSQRIEDMAKGLESVALLPDPVGICLEKHVRNDGLEINKVSVPLGVVAIIYESRPNVTADACALALKSGNACILRSGKEAYNSARAIVNALRQGLIAAGVTENAVNLVSDPSRDSAVALMTANGYVDMLIPRGGAGLINACVRQATVPCIATGTGICHVYVEKTADLDMALNIIENAKTSRPSVCNAQEVLLVDTEIAQELLPKLKQKLVDERAAKGLVPVELRLDDTAARYIDGTSAGVNDYDTEFLDYILAVKCVSGVSEAVDHISAHSTGHSEAIVTNSEQAKAVFTSGIDSAAVYVNASTRFTDGGEFGLGCEMGISTQKLHARGPMGLKELTTYKYVINGNGHIRTSAKKEDKYDYGFIGCGNMGSAVASALLKTNKNICVTDRSGKAKRFAKKNGCEYTDVNTLCESSKTLFLCIKPQMLKDILNEIAPVLRKNKPVIVSMLAGVTTSEICRLVGDTLPVIRIMPNTPVSVGAGMVLYCSNREVSEAILSKVLSDLAYAGKFDYLPEHLFNAGTSVAGCGPAYTYMFIQALADGAVSCGIPRAKALEYAANTVLGAAKTVLETGIHPEQLKDNVCSPGGSTIEGVKALENCGFRSGVINCVVAANEKNNELGKIKD